MKKTFAIISSVVALVLATSLMSAMAKDKEVTVSGEAKCAMCMLKEGTTCKTVIQVEKKGKTTTYYVKDNAVSKSFHEDVCHGAKKVTATGTVEKADGKKELTLSKIELVK